MVKTVINWHDVKEELPEESGEYLAYSLIGGICWYPIPYSAKHKAFNVSDENDAPKHTLLNVDFWAYTEDLDALFVEALKNESRS